MKKILTVIIIITLLIMAIAGCSKSADIATPPNYNSPSNEGSGVIDPAILINPSNRKVIYEVDIDIRTTDFDKTIADLYVAINDEDAENWIKSANISANDNNKTAHFILKVETIYLNDFLETLPSLGTINSEVIDSEDITYDYATTEARIDALNEEKAYYLELMENPSVISNTSLMRSYAQTVADINAELAMYNSKLTKYDNELDFSTVTIDITYYAVVVVEEEETVSFGTLIKNVLTGSYNVLMAILKGVCVAIVAVFPFLVIGGIAIVIIIFGKKLYKKLKVKFDKYMLKYKFKKPE